MRWGYLKDLCLKVSLSNFGDAHRWAAAYCSGLLALSVRDTSTYEGFVQTETASATS